MRISIPIFYWPSYGKVCISGEILSIHTFPLTEISRQLLLPLCRISNYESYGLFNPSVTSDLLPPSSSSKSSLQFYTNSMYMLQASGILHPGEETRSSRRFMPLLGLVVLFFRFFLWLDIIKVMAFPTEIPLLPWKGPSWHGTVFLDTLHVNCCLVDCL